ncbi:MAG: CRISPR system precrRNA processing endoribonuclease RAMP protein Cas6 [Nitrososphaerales archaeon]
MIHILFIDLLIDKPIKFQQYSGFAIRGLFYNILTKSNKELADELHASKKIAPFSSTPLLKVNNKFHVIYSTINKPCITRIGFSILNDDLFLSLIQSIKDLSTLPLIGSEFLIKMVEVKEVDPSTFYSYEPVKEFSVTFITPTYFRSSPKFCKVCRVYLRKDPSFRKLVLANHSAYKFIPLPQPEHLFRNLLKLWCNFINKPLVNPIKFLDWLDEGAIVISGFPKGIITHRVYEHKTMNKWVVGFTGTVHFSILSEYYDKRYAKVVDTLLRFGELTNVGGGRSAGFGMIKYQPMVESEVNDVTFKERRSGEEI